MEERIAIIGGGIAGLETASQLSKKGFDVVVLEKKQITGGHVEQWHQVFPDFRDASEVLKNWNQHEISGQIKIGIDITNINKTNGLFQIELRDGEQITANAVVIASGFDLFDAHKKEEYGYGIYDNVITSAELESFFNRKREYLIKSGKTPQRIGIIHCVGSRDEKVGNPYCSKVCCITGVKQAIELKEIYPQAEVFCFYMDLRMFGLNYEDIYKEAQEKYGIQFIRGRLSETSELQDGTVLLKVEDTLAGKPLKLSVDLVVLLVGMVKGSVNNELKKWLGIELDLFGFIKPPDAILQPNVTNVPGVFLAGACSSPKNIGDTVNDARSAVLAVEKYFNHLKG